MQSNNNPQHSYDGHPINFEALAHLIPAGRVFDPCELRLRLGLPLNSSTFLTVGSHSQRFPYAARLTYSRRLRDVFIPLAHNDNHHFHSQKECKYQFKGRIIALTELPEAGDRIQIVDASSESHIIVGRVLRVRDTGRRVPNVWGLFRNDVMIDVVCGIDLPLLNDFPQGRRVNVYDPSYRIKPLSAYVQP